MRRLLIAALAIAAGGLLAAGLDRASHARIVLGPTSAPSGTIAFVNWAIPTAGTFANPVFPYTYTTTANTNEMLVVQTWVSGQITSDSQYSAVYNGITCSDTGTTEDNTNGSDTVILAFCPLGTSDSSSHNLVITMAFSLTVIRTAVAEYSGVSQTSYLDGVAGAGGTSPVAPTMTTTLAGDWLVGVGQTRNGTITVSGSDGGFASRGTDFGSTDGNSQYADSHGTVPTGSHTGTWTQSGNMAALLIGLKHS
jgi:hypothetical protein